MPRPRRFIVPGGWFHVMNRGANHQETYLAERDGTAFFEVLEDCRSLFGLECHAFCLMTNHYHLLVRTPSGDLGAAMQRLDGVYTQAFNRRHQRDGALFRGRYKSVYVSSDAQLLRVVRYIHLNPVEATIVERPIDYRWSSYGAYIGGPGPEFLYRGFVWSLFGKGSEASRAIERFTSQGIDDETRRFYGGLRLPAQPRDTLEPPRDPARLAQRRNIETLIALAACALGSSVEHVRKRGWDNRARRLAVLLCRLEGHRGTAIASTLGITPAAITNVLARAEKDIERDPDFARTVERLRREKCNPETCSSDPYGSLWVGEAVA